jgi:dipeptidyl-peptidase-3
LFNNPSGITDVDYKHFISYAARFYSNLGNYSLYENKKLIPYLDCEKFEEILKCSDKFNEITYVWDCIKGIVYDSANTGVGGKHSNFYLRDLSEDEIKRIDEFMASKGIAHQNTRLMKVSHNRYAYLVASQEERMEEWDDSNIIGYYGKGYWVICIGEFSQFLTRVIENLSSAKEHCANDIQSSMIEDYIESLRTGSVRKHIESQIWWVKDQNPTIETNIGWTGRHLDHLGKRTNFEVKSELNY